MVEAAILDLVEEFVERLLPMVHVAPGLEAISHHLVAPKVGRLHDVSLQHTAGFVVVLGIEPVPAKRCQDRGVIRRLFLPFVDLVLDLVPRQLDRRRASDWVIRADFQKSFGVPESVFLGRVQHIRSP